MLKYIITIVLLQSCTKFHINNFTCQPNKIPLTSNISGAYYCYNEEKNYSGVIFLYTNGMVRSIGLGDVINFKGVDIKNKIDSFVYQFETAKKRYKVLPFEEGGYCIDGNKLKIQNIRYIPQFSWGIVDRDAEILNDTTFVIYKEVFTVRKLEWNNRLIFHKIIMQKPDSLLFNDWKNKKWYWAE